MHRERQLDLFVFRAWQNASAVCYRRLVPVHISIHDVSPAWERELDVALEMCGAIGAKPALLVVPNFHGAWPLAEHPSFCARLRALQGAGHDIYLHGFFHEAKSAAKKSLAWFWAQRIVSGGEAEFRDVTRDEAEARLIDGESALEAAGLRVDGFVAPAWAMHAWLMPILARRGYAFTEDHTHVYDPASGKKRGSVVLNFASRTPGRLFSSVAYCRVAKHARAVVPARVAIHPADMRFQLLRSETRALLAWAKGDVVAHGADLLA
jgi:predicted deacetylase